MPGARERSRRTSSRVKKKPLDLASCGLSRPGFPGATLTSAQEHRPDVPRARRVFNHLGSRLHAAHGAVRGELQSCKPPPPDRTPQGAGPENPGSKFDRRISGQSRSSPGVGRSSPLFWELGGGPSVAGSGIWSLLIWKPPFTPVSSCRPSGHLYVWRRRRSVLVLLSISLSIFTPDPHLPESL